MAVSAAGSVTRFDEGTGVRGVMGICLQFCIVPEEDV